ncbi:hypothetical protein ACFLT9_13510, partial [Acidobacteriota bacterium]
IPIEALVSAEGEDGFVFTVDTNTQRIKKLPIKILFLFEDKIAVGAGLEDVSKVVTEGAAYVSEGEEVKIINENSHETF